MAGTMLGLIYIYGFDDEESAKRGISYFYQAGQEGDIDAFREIALCILYGRRIPKDESQGLAILKKLAEENEPLSITALGNWYMNQKEPYFSRAADMGGANAKFTLGDSYFSGTAVPRNLRKAQELFQRAALKGQKEAEKELKIHFS